MFRYDTGIISAMCYFEQVGEDPARALTMVLHIILQASH